MLRRAARRAAAALSLVLVAAALCPVLSQDALISPGVGGTTTAAAILGNGVGPPGRWPEYEAYVCRLVLCYT